MRTLFNDDAACASGALLDCASVFKGQITAAEEGVEYEEEDLHTALGRAAKHGLYGVCLMLMQQYYARSDSNESEALRAAAEEGHLEMCKLLMDPEVAGDQD